jgi:putative transposase
MNEHDEQTLRRKAIRLTLRGWRPRAILRAIPRSRAWLAKWQQRFYTDGWRGLGSQSRRPQHSPQTYPPPVRAAVVRARQILERRTLGLIGPAAIQAELRSWPDAPPVPTERYLPGGAKVYAFHTIDVQSRALTQTISPDKAIGAVRAHLLAVWTRLGRPAGLQMDNDGAFCGGYKVARVFGQVVRLCLYVGVEPIFLPVGEPRRNGLVERVNGLWSQAFWRRRHFTSLAEVAAASAEFEAWYMHEYHPPALRGRTPAQVHPATGGRLSHAQVQRLPATLPITAGRVHFLRQVDAAGEIGLLNDRSYAVAPRIWRNPHVSTPGNRATA